MNGDKTLQIALNELKETTLEKKIDKIKKIANEIYEKKNGEVVAEDLVEAAIPKTSLIHDCFPWNNKDLGNRARLWLANQYIARIRVRFVSPDDDEESNQRVFRSVKIKFLENGEEKEKRVYKRIDDVLSQEEYRKQVVADLVMRQDYWTQEAKDFAELKNIVNEVVLERIKAVL